MSKLVRCDNCRREQSSHITSLEWHLQSNRLSSRYGDDPAHEWDFCTIECLLAWSVKKAHGDQIEVTFRDTRRSDERDRPI